MLLTITSPGKDNVFFVKKNINPSYLKFLRKKNPKVKAKTTISFSKSCLVKRKIRLSDSFKDIVHDHPSKDCLRHFKVKDYWSSSFKMKLLMHAWDYAIDIEPNVIRVDIE